MSFRMRAGFAPLLSIAALVAGTAPAAAGKVTGSLGVSVQVVDSCLIKSLRDLPRQLRVACGNRRTTLRADARKGEPSSDGDAIPARAIVETEANASFLTVIY